MKKLFLIAVLAAFIFDTAEAGHPFTLNDYLALEALGKGAAGEDRLVWMQAPPYDEIGYYGHGAIGTWGTAGFTLRSVDLKTGKSELLFKPETGVSYWFDSFSPSGRYVAFYAAKDGSFFMGAVDTKTNRINTFEGGAPLLGWYQDREAVWLSDDEFVFSTYGDDEQPLAGLRPYAGREIARRRESAWRGGQSVSVNTVNLTANNEIHWHDGRLYKANARTGKTTLLAEGRYESLTVSADGRWLAGLRQAELPPQAPDKPNLEWVRSRSQLTLTDLKKGGAPKAIAPDKQVFIETLAWAPDQNLLAFYAWKNGEEENSKFFALDADTGEITPYNLTDLTYVSERERRFAPKPERVMWVDGRLAIIARPNSGNAGWYLLDASGQTENLTAPFSRVSPIPIGADAETITILADGDVWRVGPGREPENLTDKIEAPIALPWSMLLSTLHRPFRREAILSASDGRNAGFALIDFEKGTARRIEAPGANAELIAGSVKAGALLFKNNSGQGADLILKRLDGAETILGRINSHLDDVDKTKTETITYTYRGVQLSSCALLPPNYEKGKRYPVVVEVYPSLRGGCGPRLSEWPGPYSEHLLTSRGYIVLKPNTMESLQRTEEGPQSGMPGMVDAALDELIGQGYADQDHIGVMGISQGGFSSLWLATQMPRLKATVSLNGVSDMYVHYFDATLIEDFHLGNFGFPGAAARYEAPSGEFGIGKTPYEDPLAYIIAGPLYNTPKVSAPIMLIHGDMDGYGGVDEYERMFVALNQQGKPAKLLRYWGEGHGPSSPANIRHMWGEIFDWFDCYLKEDAAACSKSDKPD